MKLRYFRLRDKAPHTDTKIIFGREELLGLTGSLHFLVGINGTGKSRLLQTLVETLMHLENNQEPSYTVTLAYDLPHPETQAPRTILFHTSKTEAGLYEFKDVVPDPDDDLWESLENEAGILEPNLLGENTRFWERGKQWASMSVYLPQSVLVYTSGAIGNWEQMFAPQHINESENDGLVLEATREYEVSLDQTQATLPDNVNSFPMTVWVRGEDYRAALLVAVLATASQEFEGVLRFHTTAFEEERRRYRKIGRAMPERFDEHFRSILDEIGWLYPITTSLTFTEQDTETTQNTDENKDAIQNSLRSIASSSRSTPNTETLHFDLRRQLPVHADDGIHVHAETVATLLLRDLTRSQKGDNFTAFEGLRQILYWQRKGYLKTEDIRIVLRKLDVPDPIPLESLSDGERMFLGRMALMSLIGDTKNTLVILDEPETHFNDYWKREMVDIVDRTLETQNTDVLITTHSSIALTDAFSREINRLFRSKRDPQLIKADHPRDPTFGATPTEVLQEIFEGPRAVGQRAAEFLDTLLVMLSYPKEVLNSWEQKQPTQILKNAMYAELLPIEEIPWTEVERQKAKVQLDKKLEQTLQTIFDYGNDKYPVSERLVGVVKNNLMPKVGAGYYRFEFSRRLMLLESTS